MKDLGRSAAVVAFSCKPNSGSEWGVGWNYLCMIARTFDRVTLFVRDAEDQLRATSAGLQEAGLANVEIVPVADLPIYRLIRRPALHKRFLILYYFVWLWKVFFLMVRRKSWRTSGFLFHVTWMTDWIFSPPYLLPFARKIVGPIGSQLPNFNRSSSDYWASRARVSVKTILRVCSPNFVTALLADGVFGISRKIISQFPWSLPRHRVVMTAVFCEMTPERIRQSEKIVLFIGKHYAFKNLDLFLATVEVLLRADPQVQVYILGDTAGSSLAADFVRERALEKHVHVLGKLPLEAVGRYLSAFHTVVLQPTSECTSTVSAEAVSLGTPVVCARGYGVDAFFPAGSYPHAVDYHDTLQFARSAADEILRIFSAYDFHAQAMARFSDEFSLAANQKRLQTLVRHAAGENDAA